MRNSKLCSLAALTLVVGAASATTLTLTASQRSSGYTSQEIEGAAKQYAKNLATLTSQERQNQHRAGTSSPVYAFPVTIKSTGTPSNSVRFQRSTGITLQFEPSGSQSFTSTYKTLLEDVFAAAKPTMDLFFGIPTEAGTVKVLNYDATLGDREVVGGGIYIHNNGGNREIRFPVYQDGVGIKPEVTAVNFIHTLLLAYQGSASLPWDGWNEGLVRAAVMRIVRTPGALPSALDPSAVEDVLSATYDIGPYYDWNNQRALGGPLFVAPNLRNVALPIGGSVGGLYLLRYQMSGSAFQKVLTQYPTFAADFRTRYQALSTLDRSSRTAVISAAQASADNLSGGSGQVEGQSISNWFKRQFILETALSAGFKVQVQPFAVTSGLSGTDFGVFGIQAHAFETATNGNETLARETSYPIYWTPDFGRFFTAAQDDRIDIIQGYGSVVPNFPGTAFAGAQYRVTVDVPVRDVVQRVMLPAGSIATPSIQTRNLFGTVSGFTSVNGSSIALEIQYGSTVLTTPIQNFAFGLRITDVAFDAAGQVTLRVKRTLGSNTTTIFTRTVNKGPGPLGVQLDIDAKTNTLVDIPKGVSMVGTGIDPWTSDPSAITSSTQIARWNSLLGRFQFYPDAPIVRQGTGYFVRSNAAQSVLIDGSGQVDVPISVALSPGWNIISNPLNRVVALTDIQVVEKSSFPATYSESLGTLLGVDMFRFVQGANDPVSLAPEGGSFSSVNVVNPGQALFVKCLSPNGVTMVFGTAGNGNTRSTPIAPVRNWAYRTKLLQGTTQLGDVVIGGRDGATNANDARFDSQSPPDWTARTISVGGLYRDTRPFGPGQTFVMQLSGLKAGTVYRVNFESEGTSRPNLRVFETRTSSWTNITSGFYQFVATATTRTLQVQSAVVQ